MLPILLKPFAQNLTPSWARRVNKLPGETDRLLSEPRHIQRQVKTRRQGRHVLSSPVAARRGTATHHAASLSRTASGALPEKKRSYPWVHSFTSANTIGPSAAVRTDRTCAAPWILPR
jgi:hypothetical protein